MAKVKVKKKSTLIDMTAMSDVTVLLLTFFMLTSTFIKKEPVQVQTPASVSEIKVQETDVLQILVDPSGNVFLSLDQRDRIPVLMDVVGVADSTRLRSFELLTSFGVPIDSMPRFLTLDSEAQDAYIKKGLENKTFRVGIPIDTAKNNEFKKWVRAARLHSERVVKDVKLAEEEAKANGKEEDASKIVHREKMQIAIKADAGTPYDKIKLVMDNLRDINENRYKLLTTLKTVSE